MARPHPTYASTDFRRFRRALAPATSGSPAASRIIDDGSGTPAGGSTGPGSVGPGSVGPGSTGGGSVGPGSTGGGTTFDLVAGTQSFFSFPSVQPAAASNNLTIFYQGEAFPVTKDRFIIGRGKQTSDLTIKDPNVSRQHAMIEYQNGVFFMVDMGSTNGVEYNGQRIARKQIAEGDVFRICDHDLRFTYR